MDMQDVLAGDPDATVVEINGSELSYPANDAKYVHSVSQLRSSN